MPRVLRIINRFNLGGPIYNASYLTAFMAPEFETVLIGGPPLPDESHSGFIPQNLGIEIVEIAEMSRSINPINDLKAWMRIRKIIREFKPDIVHTHASKAGALGRTAAIFCGVPHIVHTYHGHVFSGYFSPIKSQIVQTLEKILCRRSHAIITISKKQYHEIVEEFKICNHKKAHIIPLGLDLNRFSLNQETKRIEFRQKYKIANHQIAIGIIGRLVPIKNHRLFVEAICLAQNISQVEIVPVIIGDGNDKDNLVELFNQIQTEKKSKAIFTSWIKDVDTALPGLDIVALTSLNEGTPVSLIEAQAASRPVITTNVGGVSDCLLDGQSGIIINDFEVETFASGLLKLANDEDLRTKMGEIGKQFVNQKFNYSRLIDDMIKLYLSLLNQAK